jgi:hypothetical protein
MTKSHIPNVTPNAVRGSTKKVPEVGSEAKRLRQSFLEGPPDPGLKPWPMNIKWSCEHLKII